MEGSANIALPFEGSKGEFSRTVTAIQILVSASLAYRLLRSLALRSVCEWWQKRSKIKLTRVGAIIDRPIGAKLK